MKRTTLSSKMRDIAQRLLAYESAGEHPIESHLPPVYRVIEKIRRTLSTLAGDAGFHSLLARSLTLAKRDAQTLNAVRVMPDGSLVGLGELHNDDAAEAGVILIAHLLELLATLIGEFLVLRLVHDVWPDLRSGGTDSGERQPT